MRALRLLALLLVALLCPAQCAQKRVDPWAIPPQARLVLKQVRSAGQALPGYVGGRPFRNLGRNGEAKLPTHAASGQPIAYREWDIHPKVEGRNRGPERLVTGSDGRAWYTADHYCTFTELS